MTQQSTLIELEKLFDFLGTDKGTQSCLYCDGLCCDKNNEFDLNSASTYWNCSKCKASFAKQDICGYITHLTFSIKTNIIVTYYRDEACFNCFRTGPNEEVSTKSTRIPLFELQISNFKLDEEQLYNKLKTYLLFS